MRGSKTATPRWVKVFGALIVALILLFITVALLGDGHGPGRHAASMAALWALIAWVV